MSFNFPNNPQDLDRATNQETGALYEWRASLGKWVLTQEASLADDLIWEGVTEPPAGEGYKLWYNTNDNTIYFESCDAYGVCTWVETSSELQTYVRTDGDQMTDDLQLINSAKVRTEYITSDSGTLDLQAGAAKVSTNKLNVYSPSEFYNHMRIDDTNNLATEYVLNVRTFANSDQTQKGSHSRLGVLGNGSVLLGSSESTPFMGYRDHHAVSKKLLDDGIAGIEINFLDSQAIQDERISANELAAQDLYSITDNQNTRINANSALIVDNRNGIIELEEEIEALAPSLERGQWFYNPLGSASPTKYSLFDGTGNITSNFNDVTTIFINSTDSNQVTHGFSDVEEGSYIEVFEDGDADFGLYIVTNVDDQTAGASSFWAFTVDFVKSNSSNATAEGLARFKFFELADAADPTAFVLKTGDEMSGTLTINRPQTASAANSFVIKGRVNTTGTLVDNILLKDYRRELGSNSSDYVSYYGSGGGDYEVMNRKAGDNRFVGIGNTQTITGTKTFLNKLTLSNATALDIKGKLQINGTTTNSRYLGTSSSGALEWKSAPSFSQTKSNWNETTTSSAAYIQNKPTVVKRSGSQSITLQESGGNLYWSKA